MFKGHRKKKILLISQYDEAEGKRAKKEEGDGRVSNPSLPTPTRMVFFPANYSLSPPLSERVEKAIIVLRDSSYGHRK